MGKPEGTVSDGRGRGPHPDPPGGSGIKKTLPANARDGRDMGLTPELGICPGGGYGNPLQYSGKSHERGALCMSYKELDMTEHTCSLPIHSSYCISAPVISLCLQKILITFQPQSFCTCHPVTSEKAMHPAPVLMPGKSHGRRSLVGCSPWRREELDTTQ